MNRRSFLKFSGLFSTALIIHPIQYNLAHPKTVETVVGGVVYRGNPDGSIITSSDAGKTWQVHTRLGSQYTIQKLFLGTAGNLYARIGFAGRSFDLMLSRNLSHWKTV